MNLLSCLTLLATFLHRNDVASATDKIAATATASATSDNTNASNKRRPQQRMHKSRHETSLLPSQRIVGGTHVKKDTYPWFAYIYYKENFYQDLYESQTCGGTLIAPDIVLTAAHCIDNDMINVGAAAFVGSFNYESDVNDGQYAEFIAVKEIYVHPGYIKWTADNDFAILRLSEPSSIQPVKCVL